jgi:hypothetical protein
MNDAINGFLIVLGVIILAVLFLGFPLMLLWNWLMPYLFNLPTIGFWQAVGLNFMATILFRPTINIKKN